MAANRLLTLGLGPAYGSREPWQRRVTVSVDGQPVYSTWIRTYYNARPTAPQIYMANGAVFSKKTMKQLPYALHSNVKAEFVD